MTINELEAIATVYAIPGHLSTIDMVNPATGLGMYSNETLEQIQARYPGAVLMSYADFAAAKMAAQETPVEWLESTEKAWTYALEVLPPAMWRSGMVLVGEPHDHSARTGQPRFSAHWNRCGRYLVSSRPLTIAEAKTILSEAR